MNKRSYVLIGSGGHARVVAEVLRKLGQEIAFATSINEEDHGGTIDGIPIVGDDSLVELHDPGDIELVLGVGAPKSGSIRRDIWRRFDVQGYCAATVIDPSAIIARDTVVGAGAQIMAGAIIQPGCRIGAGTIVNTGAVVDHDSTIGSFAHIAPGTTLCGNVVVGDNTLVGAGSTIVPGSTVADNCMIPAGTVVIKRA